MDEPLETAELLAFAKVVEARSVSRAAAELGVPRATISRRLARLEQRLAVRLLRRTTRALALTDAGEALYGHARIVLDAVRQAQATVRRDGGALGGTLRVAVPPITDPTFHAVVCEFSRRYPDVRLHLQFSSRHVDLLRDGFDAALRGAIEFEPGLVVRTLARAPVLAVASPAYLAQHGVPRKPKDLHRHRCLMAFTRGEVPQTHWPLARGGKIQLEGVLFTNELSLLREAALRGLGIACVPRAAVAAELEKGELVQVLKGLVEAESRFAVVYPDREFISPQLRAFVEAVAAWVPPGLRPTESRNPRRKPSEP